MEQIKIDRINELYNKSKTIGLTEEEKAEQAKLRSDYIALIRKNLRGTLDNVNFVNPDGSISKGKEVREDKTNNQ